ncbi:hypothetical protein [Phascolarctobacterium sp.]|uniref:hypothetical protein n=1 Tax=Phascolarctobacterium sp. TaxID=2049039 RepID=UPI0025D859A3|nr:hypothetical protein [Phascolarctobacterium sp.]
MARPKKNGVEQPLKLDGNNMPMENKNAQQSQENTAQQQSEEQVEENEEEYELPFEIEDGVPSPIDDNGSFIIYAPTDIETRKGRIPVKMGITLKEGYRGLIVPIEANALYGIPTESDYRLQHSDVISTQVGEEKKVMLVLSINDETMIQEQTNFGSRSRNLIIPKGAPLAILMIFKL